MPPIGWFCTACKTINSLSAEVCGHCGLSRNDDASKSLEVIESTMNTLEITGITTDHMGSLHLKVEGIMDMIHIQATALENDNKRPKFMVMSEDVYERMCYELTNYYRCSTRPIEYNGMQIVIDTYADPTTLRVLPEVHRYG